MAQNRSHVPQFGNWESEDNVPYTVYFEKARQGRTAGGKIINPNDPEENADLLSVYGAPVQSSPSRGMTVEPEEPMGRGAVRRAHERQRSREGSVDYKSSFDSPTRNNDNMNRQHPGGRVTSAEGYKKPVVRGSVGSENSIERSPLSHHAKNVGRGGATPSPAREGKYSYDSSHGTPGRSRLKSESSEKGAAVPKFGEWENNPESGDGYTHIFNQVRKERIAGGSVPSTDPSQTPRRSSPKDPKCGCFPW